MATPLLAIAIGTGIASPAAGQARPAPSAEFAIGTRVFLDETVVAEPLFGGAVRFYVSPRVSIGPEVAFFGSHNRSHVMVTGNVTFDFFGETANGPPAVTPFVVVGGGLFRTHEDFRPVATSTHTEGRFTAGGGIRGSVGRHIFFGAEARVGWEPHLRLNALVGVRFGK